MATTISLLPRMPSAIGRRIRKASKNAYQKARWRNLEQPKVLFIVGCQRSGTTLMTQLFDADLDCRVFGEFSELSSLDALGIRLNPLPDVAAQLQRVTAPLVVAKPLVETQNVLKLLDYFPESSALFMYRSAYQDVVKSDLAKFGEANAIENIRPIATNDPHNWRSEGASPEVREIVQRFFAPDMQPVDAAALFWWARNRLFLDLGLPNNARVRLCNYEYLTQQPVEVMRSIYGFIGLTPPHPGGASQVRRRSTVRQKELPIAPEVAALCECLRLQLDAHHERTRRLNGAGQTADG